MKIGLVCPYDIFRGGGVQEHVMAQAAELRRRGYEVKVLTPRPRKFEDKEPEGIIFAGSSAKLKTPIKTTLELGMSFRPDDIDDILMEEDFDVLHVHEPEVPILGSQIVAKARCPIVATFHAIHPDTPMAWTIEAFRIPYSKSIFSKLDEITAVSDVAAGFVKERTGRPVSIIPNGIDLSKYRGSKMPAKTASKHKTILYVGRLEKRKGVKCLIKAFAEFAAHDKHVYLHIVGDGSDREKLESYVTDNEIPRITFAGFVSDAQKVKYFAQADLFCSPALYGESFGIVLLEAMAMGLVTVAGNNDGYTSVMQGTGQVSLINPKNTGEFADRLELLLYNEELRKAWLTWAQKYVQQFDYTKVVDKYEVLYKKLGSKK